MNINVPQWTRGHVWEEPPDGSQPVKMGFERQRIVTTGYGVSGHVTVDGHEYWYSSGAERDWLRELDLCIRGGKVRAWQWQPEPIRVEYEHCGKKCVRTYRPDSWVDWVETGEEWLEIKYGRIEQKSGQNIVAFLLAFPERKFCLVWKGPTPKGGKGRSKQTTKREWDKIMQIFASDPEKYHVWYL